MKVTGHLRRVGFLRVLDRRLCCVAGVRGGPLGTRVSRVLWRAPRALSRGQALALLAVAGVFGMAAVSLATAQRDGQTNHGSELRFELATIKPAKPGDQNSNFDSNYGHVMTENIDLMFLMKQAYGLNGASDDQVEGAPEWARTQGFDIVTKEDDATAKTVEALRGDEQKQAISTLVRHLLEDRFGLKARVEYQSREVLALVQAKGGAKLQVFTGCSAFNDATCHPTEWQGLHNNGSGGVGHIEGRGVTLADLADLLPTQSEIGGRMVVDATGLPGRYNFEMRFASTESGTENAGPSLFAALQDQLGLRLEKRKLPVKVLVVEQVSKPSPN